MTVVQFLDWFIDQIPRYIDMFQSMVIAPGVNVWSFQIGLWILVILIVSLLPRS